MKQMSTYSAKIKYYNNVFKATVSLYRAAVDFFIFVCLQEWDVFKDLTSSNKLFMPAMESLTISTKQRPSVKYDFSTAFYKFPCYLRRAAIAEAVGKVLSYKSNLANWEAADPAARGLMPSFPRAGYCYPALYKGNMFLRDGKYFAKIKVFIRNTWDWLEVELRKSDVDYIDRHCDDIKQCSPTLQKRGKQWYLDFVFEHNIKLNKTDIREQKILAVDLGINSACVCSAMQYDGTVLGRRFCSFPREYDCLMHKIGHIRRVQMHGSRNVRNLWRYAKGVNDDIAVKTANFIMEQALSYDVDVIVFEHLDLGKKKPGSKKQKLALWKARYVQDMVAFKAHARGIRISRVNAWNTSRLAYDGSGRVLRGKESSKCKSYSICEFQTGKVYNCDLNASYNIGARYFVREILKSLPVRDRQYAEAKIHGCMKRSTCTLSTLINLSGMLNPSGLSCAA